MAKGKIAVGAIIGALVGVATGILTAPRSGKETRTGLKTKADTFKRTATKKLDEGKEKVIEVVERLDRSKDEN